MLDILKDWLGEGAVPVANELAQKRAKICAACVLNVEPLWWERYSKEPVAEFIQQTIALKNEMKIGIEIEKDLAMCRACGCVNRLHIWTPLKHILSHTSMQTMQKFDAGCWIANRDNFGKD